MLLLNFKLEMANSSFRSILALAGKCSSQAFLVFLFLSISSNKGQYKFFSILSFFFFCLEYLIMSLNITEFRLAIEVLVLQISKDFMWVFYC